LDKAVLMSWLRFNFAKKLNKQIKKQAKNEKKNWLKRAISKTEKTTKVKREKPQKEKQKLSYNEQQEFKKLEKQIEKLEVEKSALAEKINAGAAYDSIKEWSERMGAISQELEEKENRWLELSEFV